MRGPTLLKSYLCDHVQAGRIGLQKPQRFREGQCELGTERAVEDTRENTEAEAARVTLRRVHRSKRRTSFQGGDTISNYLCTHVQVGTHVGPLQSSQGILEGHGELATEHEVGAIDETSESSFAEVAAVRMRELHQDVLATVARCTF